MFKKGILSAVSVAAALAVTGCPNVVKNNNLEGVALGVRTQQPLVVVDLEVAEKKVMGKATGKLMAKDALTKEAIGNALRQAGAGGIGADVLVEARTFYEEIGMDVAVTVIGYPARYKNFRTEQRRPWDRPFTVQTDGNISIIGYEKSAVSVEHIGGDLVISGNSNKTDDDAPAAINNSATQTPVSPARAETPTATTGEQ